MWKMLGGAWRYAQKGSCIEFSRVYPYILYKTHFTRLSVSFFRPLCYWMWQVHGMHISCFCIVCPNITWASPFFSSLLICFWDAEDRPGIIIFTVLHFSFTVDCLELHVVIQYSCRTEPALLLQLNLQTFHFRTFERMQFFEWPNYFHIHISHHPNKGKWPSIIMIAINSWKGWNLCIHLGTTIGGIVAYQRQHYRQKWKQTVQIASANAFFLEFRSHICSMKRRYTWCIWVTFGKWHNVRWISYQ